MLIPAKYFLTTKISQFLQSIESSKAIIDSYPLPTEIEQNIRRKSSLRSSLFSARIEGNILTLDDLSKVESKDQKKMEVFNILKALNWLYQRGEAKDLSLKEILNLHSLTMKGLVSGKDLGVIRKDVSAIFNSAGIAVYLPPRPRLVTQLIRRLLGFINNSKEPFVPIRACLAHYSFEKIHPFLDGNGRVGRLLLQATLIKGGYGMKGLLALEEHLDNKRSHYYSALDESEKDVSNYLEFMLEAIAIAADDAKSLVLEKKDSEPADYLLPRRAEILNIVKDQKLINFDQIRRRFIRVNERTLRYDLKKLQDAGLIRKRGTTKGVYYEEIS